ncbi:hypothetical protein TraAM80_01500 [Trypanosoma rangeli]|uniref:Uncharacterized protein n=1 Tax=Trypanosoma rangeli TaxID=5698 RepID=A0A3R7P077_TRYRA|nr:uncharacterized protein TraAM80_01500 [Trypanosoma rangeli]RNF10573.1 hypothetical protein TraAM80_01500 [Trypanosoma rangeli]|eukprot:RNF10573.1 hypothetical protein TraAM80_01500 [Trypanosoma rangeli]
MEDVTPQLGWRKEEALNPRGDFGLDRNSFFGDKDENNEHNKLHIKRWKGCACDGFANNRSFIRLKQGLVGVATCLDTLSRITVQQKLLLGLSIEDSVPEILLGGEESYLGSELSTEPKFSCTTTAFSKQRTSTSEASTCTTLDDPRLRDGEMRVDATDPSGSAIIGGSIRHVTDSESLEVTQEVIVSERDCLSRLLVEAEEEMNDLKYTYEQRICQLQGELKSYQGMVVQLRDMENARHLESLSAAEKIARYEEELLTLCKLLVLSTEKEFSLSAKKESVEGIYGAQLQCLEDALVVAARMNTVLLENAERRDLAYCVAVKEIDNLRGKLMESRDEVKQEKEMYEDKMRAMEREVLFLRPFKERVDIVEEKLRRCAQHEKLVVKYEEELQQLRSSLREAEKLVLTLKREYAALSAGLNQTGTSDGGVFALSNVTVQTDLNVGSSGKVEVAESPSHMRSLTCEIGRLKQECRAYRDASETLKEDHSIGTHFLTAKLLKAESGQLAYPLQKDSQALRQESQAMNETTTQAVPGNGNTMSLLGDKKGGGRVGETSGLRPPFPVEFPFRMKDRHGYVEKWTLPDAGVVRPQVKGVS